MTAKNSFRGKGDSFAFLGFYTNSREVAMGTPKPLALQVGAQDQ